MRTCEATWTRTDIPKVKLLVVLPPQKIKHDVQLGHLHRSPIDEHALADLLIWIGPGAGRVKVLLRNSIKLRLRGVGRQGVEGAPV